MRVLILFYDSKHSHCYTAGIACLEYCFNNQAREVVYRYSKSRGHHFQDILGLNF